MRSFRFILGTASLLLLAAAFNLFAWRQNPFGVDVLTCLGLGLLAAIAWAVVRITEARATQSILAGREAGVLNAVLGTTFFLGICLVGYALISSWDESWDLTQEGRRDLSPQTVQVLQNLHTGVEVYCFFLNVDEQLVRIAKEKTLRFLDQCQQHTGLLTVEVNDPQVAVAKMQELGINFASPQGTIVLRSGARQRVITLTGGSPRLEERDFTNALINVVRTSEPKVLYLTGHEERDITDQKSPAGAGGILEILTRESYKLETFVIQLGDPQIPAGTDIVVVNNPKGDFRPEEIEALDQYILTGGRLLLLLDPWVRVDHGLSQTENLRPWLQRRFGIEVGSDLVLSEVGNNRFQAQLDFENAPFAEVDGDQEGTYRGSYHASHPITRGFDQVMDWQASRTVNVASKLPEGVQSTALVRTNPYVWAETDLVRLQQEDEAERQPDEQAGPLTLVVASTVPREKKPGDEGNRDGRAVVIGNSYFASNAQVTFPGNINFLMNSFAWLTESEDLIAIRPSGKTDPPLLLNDTQRRIIVWVSTMLTTQLAAVAGLLVFAWRRRNV